MDTDLALAERHWPTKDKRIRIGHYGADVYRTVVQDDPRSAAWNITGPVYGTKLAAMAAVDDVLCDYFDEGPTRAMLERRIAEALEIAAEGSSYKIVDRIVRALRGAP